MDDFINLKIVLILTVGFGFASLLGYLSYRAKLSPLLGYLAAGFLIGPYSPGYVADKQIAEQLAEIGIILMMFSIGLHFKWQDLVKFKNIAISGAVFQTSIATLFATTILYCMGWSAQAGVIFGLAIGVASTVVLVRVLSDHRLLTTPEGCISVGWLIVEDFITVAALLLVPTLAASLDDGKFPIESLTITFGYALIKFVLLCLIMFTIGRKIISFILSKIMLTRFHELFTLTILAITFIIATGSAILLGTSIALGAFVAGMVVGQTKIRHQVSTTALPLREAFIVIFFLSVGMLFDPSGIVDHYSLFFITLAIILLMKPLTALCITLCLKYPFKTALTVAFALAQIGEFSFILAEQAVSFHIMPEAGYNIIVACAILSISLNPLLFKLLKKI
jgi:monovalent cation:H+ antiporter-2, CPA2 family